MQDGVTPFIVPLITHTNRLIYNSVVHTQFNPEDTINNIYPHGSGATNHNNGVAWNQFKYAVRLQTIIDAIETKYNIAFSDDFFNNVNNEQFATLFMWLHRKSGSVDRPTQVEVIQTKLQDLIVKTGSDERISTVENGIITVNAPIGVFPATFKLDLDPFDDAVTYNVQVLKNSGTVIGELNGVQGDQTLNNTSWYRWFRR